MNRTTRNLAGWNVFQRESLSQKSLSPNEYKAELGRLAGVWKAMPKADKETFNVQAEYETQIGKDLAQVPLPVKGQATPDMESAVGKSALKKISLARLQKNFQNAQNHTVWNAKGQLGDRVSVFHCQVLVVVSCK